MSSSIFRSSASSQEELPTGSPLWLSLKTVELAHGRAIKKTVLPYLLGSIGMMAAGIAAAFLLTAKVWKVAGVFFTFFGVGGLFIAGATIGALNIEKSAHAFSQLGMVPSHIDDPKTSLFKYSFAAFALALVATPIFSLYPPGMVLFIVPFVSFGIIFFLMQLSASQSLQLIAS